MSKKIVKLLPVWLSVSAVIILAGIILMSLLGFNRSAEHPESNVFEVTYNIFIANDEKLCDKVDSICNEEFKAKGLDVSETVVADGLNTTEDRKVVRYVFTDDISAEKLATVKADIDKKLSEAEELRQKDEDGVLLAPDIFTVWHRESNVSFTEAEWRGAVAVAVGAVVGLIYLGIRFGVGSALTGLILAAHDSLLTVSLLAILRIPVYATAPVFYAAVAAAVSVLCWLFICMKLRELKKDPETNSLGASEAVEESVHAAWKTIAGVEIALAAVLLLVGCIAVGGVRALVLPALIPVAAAAYSSLILGPSVHVHVKGWFDKLAKKRKKSYSGKRKSQQTEE